MNVIHEPMTGLLPSDALEKTVIARWSLTPRQRRRITTASIVLYILLFPGIYPFVTHFYFALGIIPIVVAGLFVGVRAAIYTVITVSVAQFGILVGPLGYSPERAFIDSFPLVTLLIGSTVGYLRDLRVALARRTAELERQNKQLDEFASVVSHELQNPLHAAQGCLELAQDEHESDHLEAVETAHERMEVLINDLLTLARQGAAMERLEAVDLAALTDACWQHVGTADISLVTETDRTIWADQNRLQQLLENLLSNAIEHGGENVTVTVGDLEDGFYIADDGVGIPEHKHEQVFDPGYSIGDVGTGFGLNIVKEIAEAHGWTIRITDSELGGARFEITGIDIVD
jgi:signal transduction histidine kinase